MGHQSRSIPLSDRPSISKPSKRSYRGRKMDSDLDTVQDDAWKDSYSHNPAGNYGYSVTANSKHPYAVSSSEEQLRGVGPQMPNAIYKSTSVMVDQV